VTDLRLGAPRALHLHRSPVPHFQLPTKTPSPSPLSPLDFLDGFVQELSLSLSLSIAVSTVPPQFLVLAINRWLLGKYPAAFALGTRQSAGCRWSVLCACPCPRQRKGGRTEDNFLILTFF
jgi:hypothetical protein